MDYMFYDTSSLLLRADDLFTKPEDENILISSITLQELENIKTSSNKDPEIKCAARHLLRLLDAHDIDQKLVIFTEQLLTPITNKSLEITNDTKILACAIYCDQELHPDETVFVTNDLALKSLANLFFGFDSITSVTEDYGDLYTGYQKVIFNDQQLSDFYQNLSFNVADCYINEYLIIKNTDGEVVDRRRWNGETHEPLAYRTFSSRHFGEVKPVKNDTYQAFAADSLHRNTITMLKGPAGSGKSYLALGYLMDQLEKGKIDKIIIFANPVATKGSARLGLTI